MKPGPTIVTMFLLSSFLGCSPKQETPAEVREHAANTTAEIKRDTKAVAQGIREGWTRDKTLDINAASSEQLQSLPGISPKLAESIIAHRPYDKTSDLRERHIVSKSEYEKIADQLTVRR